MNEPDHEVGDLQDALRLCLEAMYPAQLRRVSEKLRSLEEGR